MFERHLRSYFNEIGEPKKESKDKVKETVLAPERSAIVLIDETVNMFSLRNRE